MKYEIELLETVAEFCQENANALGIEIEELLAYVLCSQIIKTKKEVEESKNYQEYF